MGYDYKYLGKCEYEGEDGLDCGDPAIAYVWFFDDETGKDAGGMTVCEDHLQKIILAEEKDD